MPEVQRIRIRSHARDGPNHRTWFCFPAVVFIQRQQEQRAEADIGQSETYGVHDRIVDGEEKGRDETENTDNANRESPRAAQRVPKELRPEIMQVRKKHAEKER